MKTLTVIILTLASMSVWAANVMLPTYHYVSPTKKIALSQNNDSTIKVASYDSTSYKNINVMVREGKNATTIILHKDGDTIKHYEMNFSFSDDDKAVIDTCQKEVKKNKHTAEFMLNYGRKENKFKGHWAGFEFGLNNYATSSFSVTPEDAYMEINTGKSWNFNFNFAQVSVPLVRDRFGVVSGLGLEWNNYHFSHDNTITKDPETNVIIEKPIEEALKMNRLQTTYLTIPVLFEVQLGQKKASDRLAISAGVIAGVKLGSHTKYKTRDDKQKTKDDFYINSFRVGYTARVHYNSFGLFFNYYQTPLFVEDKASELHPFAAGLIFSFN